MITPFEQASYVTGIIRLWFLHVLFAFPVAAPILIMGRKRARWQSYELLALILPFGVWLVLMWVGDAPKSIANFADCTSLSAGIVVAMIVRCIVGSVKRQALFSSSLIAALMLLAVLTYYLMPSLPE